MQEFEPIDVKFIVNNKDVKDSSDKVKADIASVGQTAEEVTANVNKQVSQLNKASEADLKALKNKQKVLRSVSDKYRGLLDEGLNTYKGLDAKSRVLTIQLVNNRDALIDVNTAQKELSTRFKKGLVNANAYTEAMAALALKESKLNKEIFNTSNLLRIQKGHLRNQKPEWNGMANSINQITRELPVFGASASMGIMALSNNIPILADEIVRLKQKNDLLKASGQKGIPLWKKILQGVVSWQTALSLGVAIITIYRKEVGKFFSSLFKGNAAINEVTKAKKALDKAFEGSGYTKAIKDVSDLRSLLTQVKKGYADASLFIDKYNKSLGKAAGSVDNLKAAEIGLQNNADAYVKMMFYKGAAAAALAEGNKDLIENAKKQLDLEKQLEESDKKLKKAQSLAQGSGLRVGVSGKVSTDKTRAQENVDRLKLFIAGLKKQQKDIETATANVSNKLLEKAQKIANANKLKLFGEKGIKTILSSRQALLDKLTALDNEFARKRLTSDKAELKALRDKFARMRTEIERFNKKNKRNPIDISGLGTIQKKAETELKFNQDTARLKKELEAKKKLFADYETFKKQFGAKKADEQFKNQLGAFDSYLSFLKQKVNDNADVFAAIGAGTATAGQSNRATLLNKAITTETEQKVKAFNAELAALMGFNAKRARLIENYNELRLKLLKLGKTAEIVELDRQHKIQLAKLNAFALKMSGFYKRAFGDLRRYGITTIRNLATETKNVLDSAQFTEKDGQSFVILNIPQLDAEGKQVKKTVTLTIAEFNQLQQKYIQLNNIVRANNPFKAIGQDFKALQKAIKSGNNDDISNKIIDLNASIKQSIDIVNQWGDSLGQIFGKETAANIKVLTDMASGVTDLGTGIAQLATGDIVGGITNTLKGAAKLYTTLTAGAKAFREEQKRFAEELIALNLQLNGILNEQIRLKEDANSSVFIKDYAQAIFQASVALKDAQENYLSILNGQDLNSFLDNLLVVVDKKKKKFLGIITGYKNVYGSLLDQYPALIDANGKFNASLAEQLLSLQDIPDATKQGLEALIEYQKQIEANQKAMEDAISSIAGSISNDLRNALVDAWEKGTDAFTAFKGSVNKGLKQIVEQMVFNAIFAKSFKNLQKAMEASFSQGGDGSIVDDLKAFYDQAPELIQAWQDAMNAATAEANSAGFDISAQSDKKQGLSGAIRRSLTEDTGNELAGLFRGQYDVTKNILTVNQEALEAYKKGNDNTLAILGINTKIEANTANTVSQLQLAVSELKQINTNTKQSQGTRDLGGD
jgi:hypothetical protein